MNDDLISRKALKEDFDCIGFNDYDDYNRALRIIDNAPTIEPKYFPPCEDCHKKMDDIRRAYDKMKKAPTPQKWVSISERLPEEKLINPSGSDFEEVLCSTIWGIVRTYKYGKPIGHDKAHFWNGGEIMDSYIVAWMSLPEPYVKEGDV